MALELPDVVETFIADMDRYIGPMRDARDLARDFAAANRDVSDSMLRLQASTGAELGTLMALDAEIRNKIGDLRDLASAANDAAGALKDVGSARMVGKAEGGILASLMSLFSAGTSAAGGAISAAGGNPVLWIAGLVAGLAALASGMLAVIPAFAAAGIGIGAFGALAFPAISKVMTAVSALGSATTKMARDQAWDAVPAKLRPLVHEALQLQQAWAKMGAQLDPLILKIGKVALEIATDLSPWLIKFAQAAGGAILTLLKHFDKFAESKGFKQFMDQMLKLSPGAIIAIGQGLGQIAVSLGKLLLALVTPSSIHDILVILHGVAGAINMITSAMKFLMPIFDNFWPSAALIVTTVWRLIGKVSTAFATLGGVIQAALLGLPATMFAVGKDAVSALTAGMQSMMGGLVATARNIAAIVAGAAAAAVAPPPGGQRHPATPGFVPRPASPASIVIHNHISGVVSDAALLQMARMTTRAVNQQTTRNGSNQIFLPGRLH